MFMVAQHCKSSLGTLKYVIEKENILKLNGYCYQNNSFVKEELEAVERVM